MSSSENQSPSTRWWENYLVRYFTGSILGCLFVISFAITNKFDEKILTFTTNTANGKPDWTLISIGAFLAGTVLCYIASTPITVIHAGRFNSETSFAMEKHSRYFWIGWTIYLVIANKIQPTTESIEFWVCTFTTCLSIFILASIETEKNSLFRLLLLSSIMSLILVSLLNTASTITSKKITIWWQLSLPVLWIFISQYFSLFKTILYENDFLDFYQNLTAARSACGKDIQDTYRHLREHSNSIFIAVVELSIFSLAMAINEAYGLEKTLNQLLPLTAAWMTPTIFMWSRANKIEMDVTRNPEKWNTSKTEDEK